MNKSTRISSVGLFFNTNLWRKMFSYYLHVVMLNIQILKHSDELKKQVTLVSISQFSHSVVSDSLRPHESQHARPPCPSPSPRVHSDSCPLSRWCHPAISSLGILFSCPWSLPASDSFPMSQFFAWGGQNAGVSVLASFHPKNTQGWSLLGWTGWIILRDSQESSPIPQFKSINSSALSLLHSPTLTSIHDHWKNHSLD